MNNPDPFRCPWVNLKDPQMTAYHDDEWGVPLRTDEGIFEHLALGMVQAGLSWRAVLHRRENFRRAFAGFVPEAIAAFPDSYLEALLQDAGLIRNRAKLSGILRNAKLAADFQSRHGSLADWWWKWADGQPIVNRPETLAEIPAQTPLSVEISKALKAEGFVFVGPTIVYAVMQSTGLVNDHVAGCFCHRGV